MGKRWRSLTETGNGGPVDGQHDIRVTVVRARITEFVERERVRDARLDEVEDRAEEGCKKKPASPMAKPIEVSESGGTTKYDKHRSKRYSLAWGVGDAEQRRENQVGLACQS